MAYSTLLALLLVAGPWADPAVSGEEEEPVTTSGVTNPLAPLTSPDVGTYCAEGLGAKGLTELFSQPLDPIEGLDYQRAVRLADDRVLWTFQDAFIDGRLVHNAAMIQSGRCFTLLNAGQSEWLFDDVTRPRRSWHWILGGDVGRRGSRIHLFVVKMVETGQRYLEAPRPRRLHRVVLNSRTLQVVKTVELPRTGLQLYGWSVTSDPDFTYLYSHCYRQRGFDELLGYHPCSKKMKLARIPRGRFWATPRYWTGAGWNKDHRRAVPVVDELFVISGVNPAQIRYTGRRFTLVVKPTDWWSDHVDFGLSRKPQGPFRHVASVDEPLLCDNDCTYFASWVPWRHRGRHIWAVSHNHWERDDTPMRSHSHPTFHTIAF